jgi:hypothetical protein
MSCTTRVTPAEVKTIMDGCVLTDPDIKVYIEAANELVTSLLDSDSSITLSDERLKEIERWLTAYMISISRHRQTTEEKLGDASAVFAGVYGEGLKANSYGQMVLILDTSGVFGNLGKRKMSLYAVKRPY